MKGKEKLHSELVWPIVIASCVAGLLAKIFFDHTNDEKKITWLEYVIGVILVLVGSLILTNVGWNIARDSRTNYSQFQYGWLLTADEVRIECYRDGPCKHTYACDSYSCNPHPCLCHCVATDKDGKCTQESCSTCYDICWRQCPYCTHEFSYYLSTSVERITVATGRLPENPDSNRWRESKEVNAQVISQAGVGRPPGWIEYDSLLREKRSVPAVRGTPYINYFLATLNPSDNQKIPYYQSLNWLPAFAARRFYWNFTDHVYSIGIDLSTNNEWKERLMWFNATFNTQLGGDVYLILTKGLDVNRSDYIGALKAHLQNVDLWGEWTLPANAILVVVNTSNLEKISWAVAETGMPEGNEQMTQAISDRMSGQPFSPDVLLGTVNAKLNGPTVESKVEGGILADILWGVTDPSTRFVQRPMEDYQELLYHIQPTNGQKVTISVISFLLSLSVWIFFASFGEHNPYYWRH